MECARNGEVRFFTHFRLDKDRRHEILSVNNIEPSCYEHRDETLQIEGYRAKSKTFAIDDRPQTNGRIEKPKGAANDSDTVGKVASGNKDSDKAAGVA